MSDSLNRREFVALLGGGLAAAAILGPTLGAAQAGVEKTFRLSVNGSGRATGYAEASKIVTVGGRTHVAWLDATAEGFWVRVRTLDRRTGRWSPTVTVGAAQDNHGGPGLVADSKGFLHIVYYPHHQPFRYRRSVRPNDTSEWGPEVPFAESVSYPVMLCAPDDTLILTCRRYYLAVDHLNEMELWKKPPDGPWRREGVIMRARYLDYVHFMESLAWGPDGRTIHLACRIYETNPQKGAPPIETVGYLRSPDQGKTWTRGDGTPVALPVTADTIDALVHGGGATGRVLYSGSLAVDRHGAPHLLHSLRENGAAHTWLATPTPGGGWTRRDLHPFLPAAWQGHDFVMPGAMAFSASGRATIVGNLVKLGPGESDWAHPTSEIVRLWSDDGAQTFRSEVLVNPAAKHPHWLPSLERPNHPGPLPVEPGILYTAGSGGGGLKDLDLNNEVWWQAAENV